jgi:molybdopterin synthase sulfur carrier subunit
MIVELELFGALRGLEAGDRMSLAVAGARVADLRAALAAHAASHWPGLAPGLLGKCAFATHSEILRDGDALPGDGRMSVLPPVSGG